jgi:hypothetical protein
MALLRWNDARLIDANKANHRAESSVMKARKKEWPAVMHCGVLAESAFRTCLRQHRAEISAVEVIGLLNSSAKTSA